MHSLTSRPLVFQPWCQIVQHVVHVMNHCILSLFGPRLRHCTNIDTFYYRHGTPSQRTIVAVSCSGDRTQWLYICAGSGWYHTVSIHRNQILIVSLYSTASNNTIVMYGRLKYNTTIMDKRLVCRIWNQFIYHHQCIPLQNINFPW